MLFRTITFVFSFLMCTCVFAQDARALVATGDSLVRTGKALKAIAFYNDAIGLEPTADNFCSRANAWYVLDRMDRFILDVEQAIEINKRNARAHYQRSLYAMRSRDWSLAKSSCDRAIGFGIQADLLANTLICRGEALAELGQPEAAIADLKQGLATVQDEEAKRLLAALYDDTGAHQEAINVLVQLLADDPNNVGDRVNLGFELARMGRHKEAVDQYEKALALDKDEPIALSNYAYSLLKVGRNADAERYISRSLRSQPNNPYALRTRALLRLGRGAIDEACEDLLLAQRMGKLEEVDQLVAKHCPVLPQR